MSKPTWTVLKVDAEYLDQTAPYRLIELERARREPKTEKARHRLETWDHEPGRPSGLEVYLRTPGVLPAPLRVEHTWCRAYGERRGRHTPAGWLHIVSSGPKAVLGYLKEVGNGRIQFKPWEWAGMERLERPPIVGRPAAVFAAVLAHHELALSESATYRRQVDRVLAKA